MLSCRACGVQEAGLHYSLSTNDSFPHRKVLEAPVQEEVVGVLTAPL